MATAQQDAVKKKVAEVAAKYEAALSAMDHATLVNELEERALMASYGYRDQTTSMMLKASKAEILRRLKGVSAPKLSANQNGEVEAESAPRGEPRRPSLFG